jgi:hypothetical protein
MDAVQASLERLKLDHIDLYQIHGTDVITPVDETLRALSNCLARVWRGLTRSPPCLQNAQVGCSTAKAQHAFLSLSDQRGRELEYVGLTKPLVETQFACTLSCQGGGFAHNWLKTRTFLVYSERTPPERGGTMR